MNFTFSYLFLMTQLILFISNALLVEAESVVSLRIVGGTPVEKGEYPFQAGLRIPSDHHGYVSICGGSLIDSSHVLTAAHCLYGKPNEKIVGAKVYLNCLRTEDHDATIRTIQSYVIHPEYKRTPVPTNDLAIITLDSSVDDITPVVLTSIFDGLYVGESAIVIGRGETVGGNVSTLSKTLLQARVTLMSNEECATQTKVDIIPESQICAGAPGNTCQGDSGDPLLVAGVVQVGIVSYSEKPCDPAVAGVYTRVSYYSDWIQSIITADSVVIPDQYPPSITISF